MTKISIVIDYIFITPTIRVDKTTTVSGSRSSYLTQRPQYYPIVGIEVSTNVQQPSGFQKCRMPTLSEKNYETLCIYKATRLSCIYKVISQSVITRDALRAHSDIHKASGFVITTEPLGFVMTKEVNVFLLRVLELYPQDINLLVHGTF